MLAVSRKSEATVYELPGRTWGLILGPENAPVQNLTLGVAVWPAGSCPPPHTHATQEEIVYVLSGHGVLHSASNEVRLEPGTAGFIPIGVEHWVTADDREPLEFITIFSPPNNPGERTDPSAR